VGSPKAITIFYPGNHTDYHGRKVPVSKADLQALVDHTNRSGQRIPLVVGHPATNDESFGFASKLAINDRGHVAVVGYEGLSAGFSSIVNEVGSKISAKLRLPGNPANKSSGLELDHIGFFFGKQRVALDKLPTASFSRDQFTSYIRINPMDDEDLKAAQIKLAADQAEFAKQQAEFAAKSAEFAAQAATAPIVDQLIQKGCIPPAQREGMLGVFSKLSQVPEDQWAASFSKPKDGGNAAVSFLRQAFEAKAIPLGKDAAGQDTEAEFMAGETEPDDDESMAMDKKIKAHMKKNPGMSYGAAMEACASK
jgi:hypothetical protein